MKDDKIAIIIDTIIKHKYLLISNFICSLSLLFTMHLQKFNPVTDMIKIAKINVMLCKSNEHNENSIPFLVSVVAIIADIV